MAVGYDNIDVEAATERDIWISNTPDVLTESTADLTMALILAACRRIVEADAYMREGKYEQWDPRLLRGVELGGKTLGIFGFGSIGQAVARRASAFGMNILFYNRSDRSEAGRRLNATQVRKAELLDRSDIISLHTAYHPELNGAFGEPEFAAMKNSAWFFNTARGPLMNEQALLNALKTGQIAGAGLDVYEHEPDFEAGLAELKNVVMLPHIGSATHETRDAMATLAAKNIIAVLDGGKPITPVNKVKG
jgi:glyoxylate reductase